MKRCGAILDMTAGYSQRVLSFNFFESSDRHAASHCQQCFANGIYQLLHVGREDSANIPDPERIHLREFTRVNDESACAQVSVKRLERKFWILRRMESPDDAALDCSWQI